MKNYYFDTQEDVTSDIIGGKALSLVQMTRMGLNVPFGFAISSDLWKLYQENNGLTKDVKKNILLSLNEIEKRTGQTFGDITNPLIVSARSGAKFSMPGMMETILDIGITPENLPSLISKLGKQAALSSYQQFLRMFGHSVLEIDHKHFSEIELQLVGSDSEENLLQKKVELFTKVINDHHGVSLNNPQEILFLCIQAVLDSFSSQGAIEYRNMAGIPHDIRCHCSTNGFWKFIRKIRKRSRFLPKFLNGSQRNYWSLFALQSG
jgi:pyruvate,orthophosphate dikinase